MNCIQPDRAGRADVEVAAVVGLDLVDRRQHLPAHAVLDAGGLVDREQERRDAEVVDGEVRHANRQRAQRGEQRRRRVDGEGAGGRRDRSVGRGWSVGRRRSVLGLRRLGARIVVPRAASAARVRLATMGAVVRGLRSRRRGGVVVRRIVTGGGVRGRRRGRRNVGRRTGGRPEPRDWPEPEPPDQGR